MPDSDQEAEALKQNYQRNLQWAKRGEYRTKLSPREEQDFQLWVWKNKVPFNLSRAASLTQDYDMRGFWKAMQSGDPIAVQSSANMHFPDRWKTPYHQSFSAQSMYATPEAPDWVGNKLVDKKGNVIFADPQ